MMKWLSNGKSYFFAAFILIFGCGKKEALLLESAQIITGLASPIQLAPDTTILDLQDWVLEPELIDSISVDADLGLKKEGSKATLLGNLSSPLSTLSIWSNGRKEDIVLIRSNETEYTFRYSGNEKQVSVKGEFNAWNTKEGLFQKKTDGSFEFKQYIDPGRYQYVLVVDGEERLDPSNKDSVDNGQGGWNSLLVSERPRPSTLPYITATSHTTNEIEFSTSTAVNKVYGYFNNSLLDSRYVKITNGSIHISIPTEGRKHKRSFIRLWAYNDIGVSNDVFIPLENGEVLTDYKHISRQDKHGLVMYFLMMDRFLNGNASNDRPVKDPEIHPKANYYGGDIAGVTHKVQNNYFQELGINTLWLSPITQNPDDAFGLYPNPKTTFSGYHGYWPISSSKIDDRFGTGVELKALVEKAHDTDMNVILDYVANHVHEQHPVFKEHPEWATELYLPDGSLNTRKWDEHRLTTWFDTFLPTLDLSRPEIIAPMTDSALYWLEKYELDGFRHDATKHIPLVFWRELTKKIKQKVGTHSNRNILQIGETYGSRALIKSYISSGMLDAQFDFNVYDDAVATFARPEVGFDRLTNSLRESLHYYGDHNLMGYITGNQDRPRFISYADGSLRFDEDTKLAGWTRKISIQDTVAYDKLASLTAFMMAIPGIPVIYYGDEIGLPGGNDPDNRRMMVFDRLNAHQKRHFNKIKDLINFRRSNLSMMYGDTKIITESKDLLVLERQYFNERVLCIFNKGNEAVSLTEASLGLNASPYFSLAKNTSIQGPVSIEPYAYEFIKTIK